jgi:hypothetical protein
MIGEYGAIGGMKTGKGTLKYWEQTSPIASKQIIVKGEKMYSTLI